MQPEQEDAPEVAKFPAAHGEHVPAPADPWKKPEAQSAHVAVPEAEYLPGVQFAHAVKAVAPVALEAVPAGQATQLSCSTLLWNLPASHTVQLAAPDGAYLPALQGPQSVEPEMAWDLPAAQEAQPAAPVAEKLPAAQLEHAEDEVAPVAAEKDPAAHAVQAKLEANAKVPAGHTPHVDNKLAPTTVEYMPAAGYGGRGVRVIGESLRTYQHGKIERYTIDL
jgi:hypothetical protein